MKKILKKSVLVTLIAMAFMLPNVSASPYYTNLKGVEMTQEGYEKMSSIFSEKRVSILTQDLYNKYIDAEIISSEALYQKVKTDKDGNTIEEYITEEEYANSPEAEFLCENDTNNTRSSDYAYIETSYKRLAVDLADFGNNHFVLTGELTWKKVPACRSYDVFAFRTNHMSHSNVYGIQTYFIGNAYTDISYNSSSAGYKNDTNGAGFSMNLKDGNTITGYDMILLADLAISNFNVSTAHVYTTYQHAISSLTRAQSMSYTFGVGGLGDVLLFSSTNISQKYDDMAGIHLSTPV